MTEKLYYQDSFMTEFTATVLACEAAGKDWAVVLDRTAFYPEGGGQPADHGMLDGVAVTDTRDRDGEVVHTCVQPLEVGKTITGRINFARRFDFMQQHSGEHIVSGIICGKYECDNVGFHIGKDLVTIDFNADIPPEDLPLLERTANDYIWQDLAPEIEVLNGEALEQAVYRSKKFIPGDVRLVRFPGADRCACCGTHVKRAGQVGLVKLLSCQKFREGVRIEMAAGGRAVSWCSAILTQNTMISRALSAKAIETAAAVERTLREVYTLRGRVMALEEADFAQKAAALSGKGDVVLFEGEMSAESVRKLASAVLETCGGRCLVFAGGDETGYKYAAGLQNGDLRSFVKELNTALSGRGGGKPSFAQGTVGADRASIEAFLKDR